MDLAVVAHLFPVAGNGSPYLANYHKLTIATFESAIAGTSSPDSPT